MVGLLLCERSWGIYTERAVGVIPPPDPWLIKIPRPDPAIIVGCILLRDKVIQDVVL
jgi:hypothetical protein